MRELEGDFFKKSLSNKIPRPIKICPYTSEI